MKRFLLLIFSAVMSASIYAQGELILTLSDTSLTVEQVAAKSSNPMKLIYPLKMKEKIPPMQCNTPSTGRFSVATDRQVEFAPGNLQYWPAKKQWRFAEEQWDYVGDAESGTVYHDGKKCNNALIAQDYNGWIDFLGWGASGWNSGANAYQPWSASTSYSDYYPGGSEKNDLTGKYANADWGVYNQIGSDPAGTWRTLTKDEWVYLFHERKDADKLFGLGSVNGVNGTIILPDDWVTPSGVSFTPSTDKGLSWKDTYYKNSNGDNFSHNTYTVDQWSKMEQTGAVFLPAAGYRNGTSAADVSSYGSYWSSSQSSMFGAYGIDFSSNSFDLQGSLNRSYGFSVRLVR